MIDAGIIKNILDDLEHVSANEAVSRRAGKAFGIRNLLNVPPSARALANSPRLSSLVEPILGGARVVRGIYFDKNPPFLADPFFVAAFFAGIVLLH